MSVGGAHQCQHRKLCTSINCIIVKQNEEEMETEEVKTFEVLAI